MMFKRLFTAAALWLAASQTSFAQPKPADEVRAYVFGNSLIHHLAEEDHTNVPHWLDLLAEADGRRLALDGQWGFIRNFADGLPPSANWSFNGVDSAWNSRRQRFGDAGFTAFLVNPANFIQYQAPDRPYDGENARGESPVDATLRLFDWVTREAPGVPVYIYEGWAEMDSIAGSFPPRDRGLRRFHDYNQGDYHDWFTSYRDMVAEARPDWDVRLIPVASTLSWLLSQEPLSDLAVTDLYSDGAPHGRPTLYFLAAMITYAALYETPLPENPPLPSAIHPTVREAYPQIAAWVWERIEPTFDGVQRVAAPAAGAPAQQADAAPEPLAPVAPAKRATPAPGAVPDGVPALAMGLNGIADWSTQHPFINVMKTARPWIGHLPGQWGGVDVAQLREEGHLNAQGWPIRVPDSVTKLETFLFTDQFEQDDYLRGTWLVRYEGTGSFEIGGRAQRVQLGNGEGRFFYEPGEGLVSIALFETDPNDPIRNIAIFKEEHLPLYDSGVLFNPDWIALIEDLRSVRYMDWMQTNGSTIATWDQRPRLSDYSWVEKGVPLEVMVALANQIGADPWFNMPHLADDDYVTNFATYVRDALDPRLMAYVEYSNEVWNFIFPQAHYAAAQAEALWGRSEDGWMQYYGLRAAQVMDIWTDVYGAGAEARLIRTMATHTGWQGLEETILQAPLAMLALGRAPQDSFDAYAVTGYFGFEMGGEEYAGTMRGWLDDAERRATRSGEEQGLRRIALREYVNANRFEPANAPVANALRDGSLKELIEVIFPYHASAAQRAGLDLVMYEGGTHVAGHGEQVSDDRLTEFFIQFNYSPEMAAIYLDLLEGWRNAGGRLFNAFVDVAPPSQWGSWGARKYLGDDSARWDALMAFNASGDGGWQNRPVEAFANGLRLTGTNSGETLTGSGEEDTLIGGGGNDRLISNGASDHLHGGEGVDTAVLPGSRGEYVATQTETGWLLSSPYGLIQIASVERLEFADGTTVETTALN